MSIKWTLRWTRDLGAYEVLTQFILGLKNNVAILLIMAMYVRGVGIWGIYEPSCQFCCNPKTVFKKTVLNKNNTQVRYFWQNFHFTFTYTKLLQLCPTLCDPRDCRPPGSSDHGILQARILERVAISSSRGSSQLRDRVPVSYVSCIAGGFFTGWAIICTHTVYMFVLVGLWCKMFFGVKNVCRPL